MVSMPRTSSAATHYEVSWAEYRIFGPLTHALSCLVLAHLGASVARRLQRQEAHSVSVVAAEAVTTAASVGFLYGIGQFVRRTFLWFLE